MSTEQDLSNAANRLFSASGDTFAAYTSKVANINALLTQANQNVTAALAAAARAEAAANAGGGSSNMFALLQFNEAADNSRPATWVNSVVGGSVFYNYGEGKTLGARAGIGGPFGLGAYTEGADGNNVSVTSADVISIPTTLTLQSLFRAGTGSGAVMQFSTTGIDSGAVYIRVTVSDPGVSGQRTFTLRVKAFGFDESFTTSLLTPLVYGGNPDIFHIAIQREANNKFTFRSQGQLLATTTNTYAGTLAGHWDAYGSFEQVAQHADSAFRTIIGTARGDKSALYTGSTYTVPTARFTL